MQNKRFLIFVIVLSAAFSASAQLRVKNSANREVVIATQDGRVGIGMTAPSQIIGTFHVLGSKFYNDFWGIDSWTGSVIQTNGEGIQNNQVERALVTAVPYSATPPLNTMFRKAVTAVLWNQTDNTFPIAASLAFDQNYSGMRQFIGVGSNVHPSFTFPAGSWVITGYLLNPRIDNLSFSLYSSGAAKSYFNGPVGIGTTLPTSGLQVERVGHTATTMKMWTESDVTFHSNALARNGLQDGTRQWGVTSILSHGLYAGGPASHHAVVGYLYNGDPLNGTSRAVVQGGLGVCTNVTGSHDIQGLFSKMDAVRARALNTQSWADFVAGGLKIEVDNNASYSDIYAIYATGAKSYFTGAIGIGTTEPGADLLDVRGRAYASGGWQTTNGDYAEWFEKEGDAQPGDLIGINLNSGKVRRYQPGDKVLGICSATPAVVGNRTAETDAEMSESHILVGLLGQLPFKSDQVALKGRRIETLDGAYVGILLGNGKAFIGR